VVQGNSVIMPAVIASTLLTLHGIVSTLMHIERLCGVLNSNFNFNSIALSNARKPIINLITLLKHSNTLPLF